ncbi:hypothetical protein E2K93_02765 [Thalassotalea sp. HSM 43]|uniref:hypothetical protein n=1 Tax=Thalassotalea sp. HSM 43 TaxID=2552945 RepID=UPI0010817449|nr:hypothetical protein [Thalassotalea sp. HSM 43]QBY03357.1 hypothetical protein E2K93_02765 [Thalassotalea sp. HSM 43]
MSACTSVPEVSAQRPLIEQSQVAYTNAELLPESMWIGFNQAYKGTQFSTEYGQVLVENTYVSAMGRWCVAFSLFEHQDGQQLLNPKSDYYGNNRRACKDSDKWFFITPLMQNNNYKGT